MQAEDIIALVDEHGTAVYRFCHKLTRNQTDADDLYQETFLAALEKCHTIDQNRNPKAYLLSIAVTIWKNNCRKFARRQRLAPTVPLEEADQAQGRLDVEELVITADIHRSIRAITDDLGDKYRIPIYLYYTLEMDVASIADVLGIPSGTVKSRLHKARALIQKRLEAKPREEARLFRAVF